MKLLVETGGGIGDAICALPVIRTFERYLPGVQIDFRAFPSLDSFKALHPDKNIVDVSDIEESELLDTYDGVFWIHETVTGNVSSHFPDPLRSKMYAGMQRVQRDNMLFQRGDIMPRMSNQTANHAVLLGLNRWSMPLYSIGMQGKELETPPYIPELNIPPPWEGAYITVQCGYDINHCHLDTPTKGLRTDQWETLVKEIKNLSDIKIVQIGSDKTGCDIPGVDINMRGRTTFKEVLDIVSWSRLHVDTEGGMVHAATAIGTKCFVFFGPTNLKFFGYPQNINYRFTNKEDKMPKCNNCWWLTETWMEKCMRGLPQPSCMQFDMQETAKNIIASL